MWLSGEDYFEIRQQFIFVTLLLSRIYIFYYVLFTSITSCIYFIQQVLFLRYMIYFGILFSRQVIRVDMLLDGTGMSSNSLDL